jgi:hypothetical protein
LRTVDKVKPPYQLNQFPADFGQKLGKEIVYLLATKSTPSLELSITHKLGRSGVDYGEKRKSGAN